MTNNKGTKIDRLIGQAVFAIGTYTALIFFNV